jgi:hypothetical protein
MHRLNLLDLISYHPELVTFQMEGHPVGLALFSIFTFHYSYCLLLFCLIFLHPYSHCISLPGKPTLFSVVGFFKFFIVSLPAVPSYGLNAYVYR